MDKEKITNLFKDYGEAMRAWGESKYENDVIYEDIKGLKLDLIEELNSKITMPKVFDKWYKQTNKDLVAEQIVELSSIVTDLEPYHGFNDEQLALQDWLSSDEDFLKCVEAIINGYEVEHG